MAPELQECTWAVYSCFPHWCIFLLPQWTERSTQHKLPWVTPRTTQPSPATPRLCMVLLRSWALLCPFQSTCIYVCKVVPPACVTAHSYLEQSGRNSWCFLAPAHIFHAQGSTQPIENIFCCCNLDGKSSWWWRKAFRWLRSAWGKRTFKHICTWEITNVPPKKSGEALTRRGERAGEFPVPQLLGSLLLCNIQSSFSWFVLQDQFGSYKSHRSIKLSASVPFARLNYLYHHIHAYLEFHSSAPCHAKSPREISRNSYLEISTATTPPITAITGLASVCRPRSELKLDKRIGCHGTANRHSAGNCPCSYFPYWKKQNKAGWIFF